MNDPERRNGPYFALFYRIWYVMGLILYYFTEFVYDVVVKQLLGLSRFQNLLLIVYDHIKLIASCQ